MNSLTSGWNWELKLRIEIQSGATREWIANAQDEWVDDGSSQAKSTVKQRRKIMKRKVRNDGGTKRRNNHSLQENQRASRNEWNIETINQKKHQKIKQQKQLLQNSIEGQRNINLEKDNKNAERKRDQTEQASE